MAKLVSPQNPLKLFDEKEKLLDEQPWLGKYYSQFLQDWRKYIEFHEASKKPKELSGYLVFGASFKE